MTGVDSFETRAGTARPSRQSSEPSRPRVKSTSGLSSSEHLLISKTNRNCYEAPWYIICSDKLPCFWAYANLSYTSKVRPPESFPIYHHFKKMQIDFWVSYLYVSFLCASKLFCLLENFAWKILAKRWEAVKEAWAKNTSWNFRLRSTSAICDI